MALVFDNRSNLDNQPGLHALIGGVSLYKHLPGGGGPPPEEDWELPQLSATALTGYKIYRWLIDHQQMLPIKLATVRLLLSPSATETPEIAKGMQEIRTALAGQNVILDDNYSPCNLQSFSDEARAWRTDARTNNLNITFFYFAGHGIQRKNNDPVLLLEDFGNPSVDMLTNSVVFNKLFDGMVPQSDPSKQIARTQLYFVDACRVIPPNLSKYEFQNISNILTGDLGGVDNRSAPIFYGTVSNAKAYAKGGKQTLFSEALIKCLENDGGETTDQEDENGYAKWRVSVYSLSEALNEKVAAIKALDIDQEFYSIPRGQNTTIVNLNAPPQVDGMIEIEPGKAVQFFTLDLTDSLGASVWSMSPVNPHPHPRRLPAGYYTIKATITNPPQPSYNNYSKTILVKPPKDYWLKARVG